MPSTGAAAASDMVALAYTAYGDVGDDPVVLLPGLTASLSSWATVPEHLAQRCHVYAVDLRGHGESGHGPPQGYVLEQYTIRFCVDVVRSPAALVGHSLGGVIAFEVARARPDLVRGVALIDPPPFLDGGPGRFAPPFVELRALLRDLRARAAGVDDYESVFGSLPMPAGNRTAAEVLGREGLRELALARAALDPETLTPAIEGTLFAGAQPDHALHRPLLVLRADPGSGAAAFTDEDADRLRRTNPAAIVETLTGSGHAALTDTPHQVSEHLARFITDAC